MNTHAIVTFNNHRINVTKPQAEMVMDMLANKEQINDDKAYLRFEDQVIYLKSISGVVKLSYEELEVDTSKSYKVLPEPKNTPIDPKSIERMMQAAIESKTSQQAKYGLQSWSVRIDKWLPTKYHHLLPKL